MTFMRQKRYFSWTLWANLLLLSACVSAIPPEALNGVDHNISFESLGENPEAFMGKTVLLGGEIILTENFPHKTLLMVLQHDLDANLQPLQNDQSKGRFMVIVPEFLDPAIYNKGRRITAVGTVIGKEIRPLNEVLYVYPIIEKSNLYLWPIQDIPDSEPRVHFGIGIGSFGF